MESNLSSVIDKVKKLLALTQSSNANEAAAAAGAANKLIDQYRLSEIDLHQDDPDLDPMIEADDYIYESGKITPWKRQLVRVLAFHYGCAHWNDAHYPEGRKVTRYRLVGKTSDIQIIRFMFPWLTLECQRLSDLEAKGKGRVYVASYCEGFVNGIALQLKASRVEAQREVNGGAIIKLDARLQESSRFMNSNHNLVFKKSKSHSLRDYGAFSAGQSKGQSVHLGASLSGSKVKLLGN